MNVGKRITLLAALLAVIAVGAWWLMRSGDGTNPTRLILNGNVDIREVRLAFNGSERITALHATEGQTVASGDVLGALDKERLSAEVELAEGQLAEAKRIFERLEAGTR
ncbi:MAG: biotin/lipoyl-binding protein, partial [Alphaproteobacteria bacterium]